MLNYRYIIAMITCGIYLLALVVYISATVRQSHLNKLRRIQADKYYSDLNLVKMDYDMANYDKEVAAKIMNKPEGERQVSIDDVLNSRKVDEDVVSPFARLDAEEIETITGTYKPER